MRTLLHLVLRYSSTWVLVCPDFTTRDAVSGLHALCIYPFLHLAFALVRGCCQFVTSPDGNATCMQTEIHT